MGEIDCPKIIIQDDPKKQKHFPIKKQKHFPTKNQKVKTFQQKPIKNKQVFKQCIKVARVKVKREV